MPLNASLFNIESYCHQSHFRRPTTVEASCVCVCVVCCVTAVLGLAWRQKVLLMAGLSPTRYRSTCSSSTDDEVRGRMSLVKVPQQLTTTSNNRVCQ